MEDLFARAWPGADVETAVITMKPRRWPQRQHYRNM